MYNLFQLVPSILFAQKGCCSIAAAEYDAFFATPSMMLPPQPDVVVVYVCVRLSLFYNIIYSRVCEDRQVRIGCAPSAHSCAHGCSPPQIPAALL